MARWYSRCNSSRSRVYHVSEFDVFQVLPQPFDGIEVRGITWYRSRREVICRRRAMKSLTNARAATIPGLLQRPEWENHPRLRAMDSNQHTFRRCSRNSIMFRPSVEGLAFRPSCKSTSIHGTVSECPHDGQVVVRLKLEVQDRSDPHRSIGADNSRKQIKARSVRKKQCSGVSTATSLLSSAAATLRSRQS